MNVFMAAVYSNGYMDGQARYEKLTDREREVVDTLPNILESYYYVGKQKQVDEMRRNSARVFLDSGAFSAHTLGAVISVQDYCDYIKRNSDVIRVEDGDLMASVLDGIGDPLQTYRNQLAMEELGVRPLPCFHYGEDLRYLEHYVKNYTYITIGGMVGKSTAALQTWLDRIWESYLVDGAGNAKLKVHAFGVTSIPLMERYPWFSVDSSSWIQMAAFGSVLLPEQGKPISVSEKSPSRHTAGQHAMNLTQIEQDYIFANMERSGFTYERLSTVYESRAAFNIWAFGVISAMINAEKIKTFHSPIQELF